MADDPTCSAGMDYAKFSFDDKMRIYYSAYAFPASALSLLTPAQTR